MMNDGVDDMDNGRAFTSKSVENSEPPDIPFCGCLSVRYYQPYFDVDTDDVISRVLNAVLFCGREENFLTKIGNKPDAYGPFWVNREITI